MRVDGVPNVMTCMTPARDGMSVQTQNVLGSARVDLLSAADWFFPEGMDHHHMFTRFGTVNRLMQKVARRIAGVGTVPDQPRTPIPVRDERVDVVVVGGGRCGLVAANSAARHGARVSLVEEHRPRGEPAGPPIDINPGCAVLAVDAANPSGQPDPHYWWVLAGAGNGLTRFQTRSVIVATGTELVPAPIAGIDTPGVMHASAALRLLGSGFEPTVPVALLGEGWELQTLQAHLAELGLERFALGPFKLGSVEAILGRPQVRAIQVGGEVVECGLVALAGQRSAVYELAKQAKANVIWRDNGFLVEADQDGRTAHPRTFAVGSCTGRSKDTAHAVRAGQRAAAAR